MKAVIGLIASILWLVIGLIGIKKMSGGKEPECSDEKLP